MRRKPRPSCWSAEAGLQAYAQLGGCFPLGDYWHGADADQAVLCNLGRGIGAGDAACIELAVWLVETLHETEFARSYLARVLHQAELSRQQRQRLERHGWRWTGRILPADWEDAAIVRAHAALGGNYPLSGPSWHLDYNLSDGVRAQDPACIELGVRCIEAQLPMPHAYAGYARARLARALRHAPMSPEQCCRLSQHFLDMVIWRERTWEFREYLKLWPCVMQEDHRRQLQQIVQQHRPSVFTECLRRVIEQSTKTA